MELTADQMAAFRSPFDELVGIVLEEVSSDRAVTRLPVRAHLHQPAGIVHGGVYATVAEVTASLGANLWLEGGAVAVGASNHTDFLRPVRSGELTAVATPLQRGRRQQLWQVEISDAEGRLVAHGKVRLANVPHEGT